MAQKRKPHDDLRRAALAEAARIVTEDGVHSVGARQIAKAAGCSVGTLYNLFGDLSGVIDALNHETIRQLRMALMEALSDAPADLEARLLALADAYLAFALANPKAWDAMFRYRLGGDVTADVRAETGKLFGMLQDQAGPNVPEDALTALWAAIHGVVDLAIYRHLNNDAADGSEQRFIRIIIGTALRGFSAESH